MALVSMDNCSHNGEKLRQSVLEIARGWRDNGLVPSAYVDWMSDEENVAFPEHDRQDHPAALRSD